MLHRTIGMVMLGTFALPDAVAQRHYDNWYFGQFSALDMGTATPTLLPDGAMSTMEGVVAQSSGTGDLLFYSDGVCVWDRTHAQMPNGFDLFGQNSSTQSALAVRDPADSLRYYLFTTPALAGYGGQPSAGLTYSIVDLHLNGGLGDVTDKNLPLATPVTEKISATRHANGQDVWVTVHGWNTAEYITYPVTCAGVGQPVVSTAGRVMNDGIATSNFGAIGCMQFNAAGDALAATWGRARTDGSGSEACVDLVWFDNATGQFTDGFTDTHFTVSGNFYGYGVCFSPGGRFLYATDNGGIGGMPTHRIWQYDLTTGAPELSETEVFTTNSGIDLATMQRSSDGRIYIACGQSTFLGRIDAPEALGTACNVDLNAVDLGRTGALGLPNNWDLTPPVATSSIALRDTTICAGTPITLRPTWPADPPGATYLWSTGAVTPGIEVSAAGSYWLQVRVGCLVLNDTAHVSYIDLGEGLGPDLALCLGDSAVLGLRPNGGSVRWSDGATDSVRTVGTAGELRVEVMHASGCMLRDTVRIAVRDCSCPFHLPNAFTPDGDRINDEWGPAHACELLTYELAVFDRWGRELLRTHDPGFSWDGRCDGVTVPTGVFNYTLAYAWDDGHEVRQRRGNGHVTLLR